MVVEVGVELKEDTIFVYNGRAMRKVALKLYKIRIKRQTLHEDKWHIIE